ncbi:nucleoside-diphosphate-sugar epimerase [Kordia periserrulae]|uniref:Nucleoside-diphosphate-sugar epimerase n=1 Tax=Kordia periserrulae TaxID=701523 RepID=A0A2T6C235_9FLAO|nr:SDR family oxidoreductase [Kordia periserrulae]PTX62358.1 nucleoside-diphosphate-sugar epimerase [Kordia periserrulae]
MLENTQISILGCGWLGFPLAKHFIAEKSTVKGSTTSADKVADLKNAGIQPYVFTLGANNNADVYRNFVAESDVLIINFPPKRVEHIETLYPAQIQEIASHIRFRQKVIFISSTSVYQNTNDWVTEDLVNQPEKASGKAILAAENILREKLQNRLTILRFAGLFGYDRAPGRFLANKKELSSANAPINMIHQDDCIRLISAVIRKNVWGEIINGCADVHPIRKRFYILAAKKLGLQPPEFKEETTVSFKKISNLKSKMLLQSTYKYPNPLVFVL